MALPPLYKYLDVEGAKKTLGNKCFRFAKPAEFKDLEDMTAASLFPDELGIALAKLSDDFVDAILDNPDAVPTCSERQRPKVATLQKILRKNPRAAQALKDDLNSSAKRAANVAYWRANAEAFVNFTNEFMQARRVLCVTTDKASDRMWTDYAQNNEGVVLRIEPNIEKDSKFQLFKPVTYQESRPSIYASTLDYAKDSLFADQDARARTTINRIIYAKTNDYQFEEEYRLAIPLGEGEEDYRVLAYHPEEITELYIGASMNAEDKGDILAKAKAVNPKMKVFQARRDSQGQINFEAE